MEAVSSGKKTAMTTTKKKKPPESALGGDHWLPGKDVVFFGKVEGKAQTEPFRVTNNTRLAVAFRFKTNQPDALKLHPTAEGILDPKSEITLNLTWSNPRYVNEVGARSPKLLLQVCYLEAKELENKQETLEKIAWNTISGTRMKVKLEKPPTDFSKIKQVQVVLDEELLAGESPPGKLAIPYLYVVLFLFITFILGVSVNQEDVRKTRR